MLAERTASETVQQDGLPVVACEQRSSIVAFLRRWGPLLLTVLLVPGGILLGVAMVVRHWNRRRAAALPVIVRGVARA